MDLAVTLWEARDNHKAHIVFGQWLTEQGYGETVISHQSRSALINFGDPKYREAARKLLTETHLSSWQHIWIERLRPQLIECGLFIPPEKKPAETAVLRGPRKTVLTGDVQISTQPTVLQQPVSRKPQLTEKEMLKQLNEREGYKAWMVIEDAPVIGRMPDDTEQKVYEHIREINQHCHELYQLSLYTDQMSEGAKQRLAVEFKGIRRWGQILAERMLGHKRLSQIEAPLCHIEVPFRKPEN
jgi:hypothetical protein